jgi:hypothetical protein
MSLIQSPFSTFQTNMKKQLNKNRASTPTDANYLKSLGVDDEVLDVTSKFRDPTNDARSTLPANVQQQLALNSNAWMNATTDEDRERYHQANKNLWGQYGYTIDQHGNVVNQINPATGLMGVMQQNGITVPLVQQAQLGNTQQVAKNWGFVTPSQQEYLDMLDYATNKKYTEANQGIDAAEHEFNQQRAKEFQALKNAMLSATSAHVQSNGTAGQLAATLGQLGQQTNNQINENAQNLQQQRIKNDAARAAELASNPETALNAINSLRNTLATLGLTQYSNDIQKQSSNQSGANTFVEGVTNRDGMIGYSSKSAETQADASKYATDVGAALQREQIESQERMQNNVNTTNKESTATGYTGYTGSPQTNPIDTNGDGVVSNLEVSKASYDELNNTWKQAYANGDANAYIHAEVELNKGGYTSRDATATKNALATDQTFNANVRKAKGTKLTEDETFIIEKVGKASYKHVSGKGTYSWDGTYDYNTGRPINYTIHDIKNNKRHK